MLDLTPDLVLEKIASFLPAESLGRFSIAFRRLWLLPLDSVFSGHAKAIYGSFCSKAPRKDYCHERNVDLVILGLLKAPVEDQAYGFRSLEDGEERRRVIACLVREEQKSEDLRRSERIHKVFQDTRWRIEMMMLEVAACAKPCIYDSDAEENILHMSLLISMCNQYLKIDYPNISGVCSGDGGSLGAREDGNRSKVEGGRGADVLKKKALDGFAYLRNAVEKHLNRISERVGDAFLEESIQGPLARDPAQLERAMEIMRVELFEKEGLHGQPDAYVETGSSDVLQVLDNPRKRSALPITLCVIYVAVWHRLGFWRYISWQADGGHFYAVVQSRFGKLGDKDYFVDCYNGGRIDRTVSVVPGECPVRPRLPVVFYRQLHNYTNILEMYLSSYLQGEPGEVLELYFRARLIDVFLQVFATLGFPEFPCFAPFRTLLRLG